MAFTELKLSSGWRVRVQPVPPLAVTELYADPRFRYPEPPMVEVETLAGKEIVPAPDDSPELAEYQEKCREINQQREKEGRDFSFDYGIMAWSEDGETWLTEPPAGWTLPAPLKKWLGVDYDPCLAWKKYSLAVSNDDLGAVNRVLYSMRPVPEAAVRSAEESFQD
jgi:hypothetical protein